MQLGAGAEGRDDSDCPAPSELARGRPGFNCGPRSAPRGRRPQRTAPWAATPARLRTPCRRLGLGTLWGLALLGRAPTQGRGGTASASGEDPGQAACEWSGVAVEPAVLCAPFWGELQDPHQAIPGHGVPNPSRGVQSPSLLRRGPRCTTQDCRNTPCILVTGGGGGGVLEVKLGWGLVQDSEDRRPMGEGSWGGGARVSLHRSNSQPWPGWCGPPGFFPEVQP